jgi:prophage regulatory protein
MATAAIPVPAGEDVILRYPDVVRRVGLTRWTIARLIKAGHFPPALQLTPGLVGWRRSDIDAWIASRVNPTEAARR